MDPLIPRRTVLAGVCALALAACGRTRSAAPPPSRPSAPKPDELEVLVASAQLVAGKSQRFALGVLRDAEPIDDPTVTVRVGRSFERLGPPVTARRHAEGIESRPYYLARVDLDAPGNWVVEVSAAGRSGGGAFSVIDPASTKVPLPGQKMIAVATPTTADHRGVEPICTRTPPCPFHGVSLDAALAAGKPAAVLFATPALCQSRVCGPVLDVLMSQAPTVGDRVTFIHVEVYRSLNVDPGDAGALTDAMRAYSLTFEPVLFLAGADGIVRERLDGPYDAAECREALSRLIA